jgi:outer membrane immunogenic protein
MKPLLRKIFAAAGFALVTSALATSARAADMAFKAATPPPSPAPYSWTGLYIGGNVGFAWSAGANSPLTGTQAVAPLAGVGPLTWQDLGAYPLTAKTGAQGALGGLQAGYNWQFNSVVTGIETDFDFANVSRTTSFGAAVAPFSSAATISRRLDDLGTLRGRIGFTSGSALVYATAGLAYGRSSLGHSLVLSNLVGNGGSAAGTTVAWQAGWTAGGGIEYAFGNRWSAKAEYLYYDLGSQSVTTNPALSPPAFNSWTATATVRNNGQLVRGGLNYKF